MLEIASWVFFFFFTRYHFSIFKRCRSYVHTLILTLLCDCRTPATGKHEPTNQARWHLLIANNPFSKPEEGLSADQKHRQQRIVWHTPTTHPALSKDWMVVLHNNEAETQNGRGELCAFYLQIDIKYVSLLLRHSLHEFTWRGTLFGHWEGSHCPPSISLYIFQDEVGALNQSSCFLCVRSIMYSFYELSV